ncbi:MAG TPA: galactokinase family protein [Candidatus Acidoferrales bacterium]|nr:galactokinase family protein [Candidatus Acidoferrales bacterium]
MDGFHTRLRSAGMSGAEAAKKAALMEELSAELRGLRPVALDQFSAFFVPGRLEVLGKHTDYAGGRGIICAIEYGLGVVAAPRLDALVRILDMGRKSDTHFALAPDAEPAPGHWSNYAITVARRIARDFPGARTGADIVFSSDLPRASGMSSSSALVIAVFFALAEANSLWQSDSYRECIGSRSGGNESLAGYLAAVESGAGFASFPGDSGVGTLGGSQDHVAILCSRAGFLRQYSYCPIRLEQEIPVPEKHVFVLAVSGSKAKKTGNSRDSYNRASLATRKILDVWRRATGRDDESLAAALSSSPDAATRLREIARNSADSDVSADFLLNRLDHFAAESNEIVPAAAEALARNDMVTAGALVDRSQLLAETLLGNQTPETVELARLARTLGADAASAFGAGFGGSVWALVPSARAEEFRNVWASGYRQLFPARAEASQFLINGAGPGLIQF